MLEDRNNHTNACIVSDLEEKQENKHGISKSDSIVKGMPF